MSPIENTETAPTAHRANTPKLTKKKTIGTRITLNVEPTKSAEASRIAIEITRVLHKQSIAPRYSNATIHIPIASALIQPDDVPGLQILKERSFTNRYYWILTMCMLLRQSMTLELPLLRTTP